MLVAGSACVLPFPLVILSPPWDQQTAAYKQSVWDWFLPISFIGKIRTGFCVCQQIIFSKGFWGFQYQWAHFEQSNSVELCYNKLECVNILVCGIDSFNVWLNVRVGLKLYLSIQPKCRLMRHLFIIIPKNGQAIIEVENFE